METIKELYKIGKGPSSSHTMAPREACRLFFEQHSDAENIKVVLYGSLAKTGKGHLTDKAIAEAFAPKEVEVVFDKITVLPHPMTMDIIATCSEEEVSWRVYSLGGGRLRIHGDAEIEAKIIYPHTKFDQIKSYCTINDLRLYEYAKTFEGEDLYDYLHEVWAAMKYSIKQGLNTSGTLDGGLNVQRKAKWLVNQRHMDESSETRENRLVCAYAYAVSEQNASGGQIVTAPTCGACGVLPAVLYYVQKRRGYTDNEIAKALASAGIIGNIIKTNASISGAECGCQAEIGSACAMAAAALAELYGMDLDQIEYAAEICIEHHLGLTCDPILGLVQIPCIERNAVAAMRAMNAVSLANFLTGSRLISFDTVVETMYETGRDLIPGYRETSESGLAKLYKDVIDKD